jgi:hypothetical protein
MANPVEKLEAYVAAQTSGEHVHITNDQADAFYQLRDLEVDEWRGTFTKANIVRVGCLVCSAYVAEASPTRYAQGNVPGRHYVPQTNY